MKKALVLLSGGQDSTTCLFWALKHFDEVEAICFDYGQRHDIEIECAIEVSSALNIPMKRIGIRRLLSGSSLTDHTKDVAAQHEKDSSLPSSFTAGRNAVFLAIASSHAYSKDIFDIVTGTCQTDYSGYPDCRRVFIDSMQTSLTLAMNKDFRIHTPLMYLNKAETWKMADELNCLPIIIAKTNTCYQGDREHAHEWGFGCGVCPACVLRQKGFEEYMATQKIG